MTELQPILDLLGPYKDQVLAALTVIGALRILAKPFSALIQGVLSSALAFTLSTPETDDEALLFRVLSSKPYRFIAFLVDMVASIKLPTSDAVKTQTKGQNETTPSKP